MPGSDQLPQLPKLPELTFRHFRGEADYPLLVGVQEARAVVDQIDPLSSYEGVPTLASLAAEYVALEPFAPCDNTLVVENDGEGIGNTVVQWWQEQDGLWLFLHEQFVIPAWRGRGIEDVLLDWSEHRLRQIAHTQAANGNAVWGSNATSAEPGCQRLLLGAGYQEVFSMLEMELSSLDALPVVTPKPQFTVKNAKRADYRALWEALEEAYTGRAMFEAFSEDDYQEFVADPTHDPDFEFVAWDGDIVAGMVFVRVDEHGQGVVDECNVRPAYRRQGLATALMVQGLSLLQQRGISSVRLHVRKNNETGAQQLYERLGFRVRKEFLRYRKAMPL